MSLGAQGMIVSNRNNLMLHNAYRKPKMLGTYSKINSKYRHEIGVKVELSSSGMKKVQRVRFKRNIAFALTAMLSS